MRRNNVASMSGRRTLVAMCTLGIKDLLQVNWYNSLDANSYLNIYASHLDRGKLLTSKLLSQGYRRAKLVSIVKSSTGDIMILLISSMCPFQNLFLSKHSKAFKYRKFHFH